MDIRANPDGSITVTEDPDLFGKVLAYIIPAERAHDWLVEHGAVCHHKEPKPVEVDTDALSPETRAEVEAVAGLTPVTADTAELKKLNARFDTLWTQRALLMDDVLAADRNDRLDAIEAELKELRSQITIYTAVIDIARMTNEGDAP